MRWTWLSPCLAAGLVMLLSGCTSSPWNLTKTDAGTERKNMIPLPEWARPTLFESGPTAAVAKEDLDKAMDLFRQEEYAKAQPIFHHLTSGKNVPPRVAEEALYYEGECLRMRQYLPDAADTYKLYVKEFHRGAHHYDALHRMFDIANGWLDETREAMEARKDKSAGKRWFAWPTGFVHWDKTKPLLDMEGHALAVLENVYLEDVDGPLGEKALFMLGAVYFYRENYREADHYFSSLVKFHPMGENAPRAMELAIICKQMSTGGVEYDGRPAAQARELVQTAMRTYPELAQNKPEFLQRQLYTINVQQAEKDLLIADFYRRTGHPGSAYFYYEVVRRRYAGTKQADLAAQRMEEIRVHAEQEKANGSGSLWDNLQFWRRPAAEGQAPTGNGAAGLGAPSGSGAPAFPGAPEMGPPPRALPPSGNAPGFQPVGWPAGR